MLISKIILKNWRNFKKVEVDLHDRSFIVGPNASGKSNLLDAIRFLRDIAKSGGGLQEAIRTRGGVSKLRCLAARSQAEIEVEAHIAENGIVLWKYAIGFSQTPGGISEPKAKLKYEKVWNHNDDLIINRPDSEDEKDERLLEYTLLEQPTGNRKFRDVGDFFSSIQYLHIVPQLLKDPKSYIHSTQEDYFGRDFMDRINKTNKNTRVSFLNKIEKALQIALPQFNKLELIKDHEG
ncbi:MAG TPA: AAA family ATPase, partial [bacterium]|nr:AAA family ATPase [bacterium]